MHSLIPPELMVSERDLSSVSCSYGIPKTIQYSRPFLVTMHGFIRALSLPGLYQLQHIFYWTKYNKDLGYRTWCRASIQRPKFNWIHLCFHPVIIGRKQHQTRFQTFTRMFTWIFLIIRDIRLKYITICIVKDWWFLNSAIHRKKMILLNADDWMQRVKLISTYKKMFLADDGRFFVQNRRDGINNTTITFLRQKQYFT